MTDVAQLDLFDRKIVPVAAKGLNLDERFARFIELNGHVYAAFVMLTREYLAGTNRSRVGAKAVYEILRWQFGIRTRGESDYNLDNSYVSRLARLAAEKESDLRNVFEFRKLRSVA